MNIRIRWALVISILLTGLLGFWFRFDAPISASLRDATGGVAYVAFWILVVAFFLPRASALNITASVLAITCVLEFLQQWHPPWLEAIRRTFLGRVLLGTTFDWTDFPHYFVGAALGWAALRILQLILVGESSTQHQRYSK